ncbi:hypothetical protein [Lacinutrix sp. Hel_I_90]|uniref:hypothetical protein n=1 Tax=Lacinutrix sp. Hel_I_90 TaxID=1249999 RepID=UPI0005C9B72C|nr:hypothetical protein [Lacinutrix sp. Hel_I_90]
MRYINAFVVILLLITFSCKEDAKTKKSTTITTILKGEVIYRPTSDTLLLLKATADARQDNQVVEIPIVDGKFNYKFTPDENLAYQLIFKEEHAKGSWQPILFFPTNGQVNFKLHSLKDFSSNAIQGGALNSMYNEFTTTILKPFNAKVRTSNASYKDVPFKDMSSDAFYAIASKLRKASPEEKKVIYKEMNALKAKGLDRSKIGKEADAKYNSLVEKYAKDKYDFITKNPTIVSYYLVIEDLMKGMQSRALQKETVYSAFNTLKEKFPDHSYTTLGNNLMKTLNEVKPSGQ